MKRLILAVGAAVLCLLCSGCSGVVDGDLVVVNDSAAVVGSITLSWGGQSLGVEDARGYALLERGESLGLNLEREPQGRVWVTLTGLDRRELARAMVEFSGEQMRLTLEEGGTVTVSAPRARRG